MASFRNEHDYTPGVKEQARDDAAVLVGYLSWTGMGMSSFFLAVHDGIFACFTAYSRSLGSLRS